MLLDGYENIFRNEYADAVCEAMEIRRLEKEMAMEAAWAKNKAAEGVELDDEDMAYVLGDEDDDPNDGFEYDDAADPDDADESLESALRMLQDNHSYLIATEGVDPAYESEEAALEDFSILHREEALRTSRVLSADEKIDAIIAYHKENGCKFFMDDNWRDEIAIAYAHHNIEDPKSLRCSEETRFDDVPVVKIYEDGKLHCIVARYAKNGVNADLVINVDDPSSIDKQYAAIAAPKLAKEKELARNAADTAKRYEATSGIPKPAIEGVADNDYDEPALENAIDNIYSGLGVPANEGSVDDDMDDDFDDDDLDDLDIDFDDDDDDLDLDLDDFDD